MDTSSKLILIRHGESIANHEGIVGGHTNSPLSDKGRQQAHETKQLLLGMTFDAAYSSDLDRASETAAIIYGSVLPPSHLLAGLRERSFGPLEGQAADIWFAIDKSYNQAYGALPFEQRWDKEFGPLIETDKQVYERFEHALIEISSTHPGQTVLVACHGGPIRILLMKLGYAQLLEAGSFANAGYVELLATDGQLTIRNVVGVQHPSSAE